ncbi:MAG: hypothetical protein ACJ72A_19440 [Nocardioidaceae bacterium]
MALLLRGDAGLLEAAGLLELSFALVSPALLPPQAAVMVSADAIAPAAASLFIVGMVFPFIFRLFVRLAGGSPSVRTWMGGAAVGFLVRRR